MIVLALLNCSRFTGKVKKNEDHRAISVKLKAIWKVPVKAKLWKLLNNIDTKNEIDRKVSSKISKKFFQYKKEGNLKVVNRRFCRCNIPLYLYTRIPSKRVRKMRWDSRGIAVLKDSSFESHQNQPLEIQPPHFLSTSLTPTPTYTHAYLGWSKWRKICNSWTNIIWIYVNN